MAEEPALPINQLARVSKLFEALDPGNRTKLMLSSRKVAFADGAVICREGEPGDEMFVVARGQVRVTVNDLGTKKELARLGPGQFFGEMAVLSGQARSATVSAEGDTLLVGFPRAAVLAVLRGAPQAREMLMKVGLLRSEDAMEKTSDV